ncbi:DUF1731 domain-containing protein [Zhihengliuella salsuginis]|uniref:DUF1731 domain-containing protein n=1 Tax=Zhihengliuella salsuginis TaxID=578222 RepID=A0ABQ3GIX7_9MICC|nr:DUF1731 domain-containing protein [Zhihengliuella salsuginis]GHD06559.1 hypothetical protein GCM10008096_16680 [Zhihengliuella salsuginis]
MAWMRTREHFLALSPERLWPVLSDLARLPEWNTAVAAMRPESADGSVSHGTPVHQVPRSPLVGAVHTRTAGPAVVTEFSPPAEHDGGAVPPAPGAPAAALAWRQKQPAGGLLVRWELIPHTEPTTTADGETVAVAGTLLRQRVSADGLFSGLFAEIAARPLASRFAENCARLYALAQDAAPDPTTVPSPDSDAPDPGTTAEPAAGLKAVIAGGTGFLGRQLAADLLCRGHDVVLLTRNPDPELPFRQAVWDGRTVAEWAGELAGGPGQRVALVNLAGKLVDVRPSAENVAALRSSRVDSTGALVEAARGLETPVDTWIQASTTAIYGDAGEDQLTEDSRLPTGPAALPQMTGVAAPWEDAVADAHAERLHVLRTSIVLEQECPAFDRLAMLARAGLGGRVGDGRQWFSWIHLDDWLAIVRGLLGLTPGLVVPAGVVNAAAPEPVRNRDLMQILRGALAPQPLKRYSLNTPAPLLNVGAAALRTDPALGLTGRYVTSRVLADAGFEFRHPDLPGAVRDIIG